MAQFQNHISIHFFADGLTGTNAGRKSKLTYNVLQVYLVADFENENFKFRTNENKRKKH